ncbi:hypothetical protein FA15DRAFT_623344 [Coprinopsis marcescibilis]|uniref:Uncharacterized protein n=1 Tax=Coprinopsis marcescibilis TaxID=230819 RepID=A0A5C3KPR7_COPMA|nr:hypothetical protein FA15DRAFT_623344 [Coprinopsis marcescibilis]
MEVPTELWLQICALACTDDGTTGRSLSMTSRFFHNVSKPFKYQSIAISRSRRLATLNIILSRLPKEHRVVKYLFVHCPHAFLDVSDDEGDEDYSDDSSEGSLGSEDTDESSEDKVTAEEWEGLLMEEQESINIDDGDVIMGEQTPSKLRQELEEVDNQVTDVLFSLLTTVAPTLQILSLYWVSVEGRLIEELIPPLPALRQLSLVRRLYGDDEIEPETDDRALSQFPSLVSLHLGGYIELRPTLLGESISDMAPSLRVLRVPMVHLVAEHFPPPRLPHSIEHVILETCGAEQNVLPGAIEDKPHLPLDQLANQLFGPQCQDKRLELANSVAEDMTDPEVWKRYWVAAISRS